MDAGPLLEQVEVLLAHSAGQEVATALQAEVTVRVERDRRVGPVKFLLDDQQTARQFAEGDAVEILVAGLQARALDVARAGVLVQRGHDARTFTTARI